MSSKHYDMTVDSVMHWAKHELHHVGGLVGVKDRDIQYAYAQSTVNDKAYKSHHTDLLKTHDQVVRVVKHLISDFGVKLNEITCWATCHISKTKRRVVRHGSA